MKKILVVLVLFVALACRAQDNTTWNHKSCAVVLTYDDWIP
jgi:hypothetical protein